MKAKAAITVNRPREEVERRWRESEHEGRARALNQWVPHLALALFELTSLAITDPTGRGDYHGDVKAVRAANREDPHRKIHEGGPAVRAAAA